MKNMMMHSRDSRKSNGARPTITKSGSADHIVLRSRSPEETVLFGKKLGEKISSHQILLLEGPLGTGKTVFAQGLIAGLGCDAPVTSPTFVLAQEYSGRLPIWHVDLYRLDRATLEDVAIEEYVGQSVIIIEWADRLTGEFPPGKRIVFSKLSVDEREIVAEV